jgi:hypothetical protein
MIILTSNVGSRVIASAAGSGSGLPVFGRAPGDAEAEGDERAAAADKVGAGWGGLRRRVRCETLDQLWLSHWRPLTTPSLTPTNLPPPKKK